MHKQDISGVVVLALRGEFDSFVTASFLREVSAIIEAGHPRIVLNMRFVKFVNSTALGAMLKVRKLCLAAGGKLVLSNPATTVREALESLHLQSLLPIHEHDEDAVVALGGELPGQAGEDDRA
jgi:anti-sigma B factor antagonist